MESILLRKSCTVDVICLNSLTCQYTVDEIWDSIYAQKFKSSLYTILCDHCDSIDCILEKRCVKFLWNLFNSDNVLFSRIFRYSMHNSDTTIGENVRYFMYKYKIVYDDWFNDLSNILNTIDSHFQNITVG